MAVAATGVAVSQAFVPSFLGVKPALVNQPAVCRANTMRMSAVASPVGTSKDLSRVSECSQNRRR